MEFKSYKSPDRNLKQRRSINFFLLLFSGIFVVILLKLVNIQIIDSEKYKIAARKQYENKITLMPYRGLIYDRNIKYISLFFCCRSKHDRWAGISSSDICNNIREEQTGIFKQTDKSEYFFCLSRKRGESRGYKRAGYYGY